MESVAGVIVGDLGLDQRDAPIFECGSVGRGFAEGAVCRDDAEARGAVLGQGQQRGLARDDLLQPGVVEPCEPRCHPPILAPPEGEQRQEDHQDHA